VKQQMLEEDLKISKILETPQYQDLKQNLMGLDDEFLL
jgi:hypothetical protein